MPDLAPPLPSPPPVERALPAKQRSRWLAVGLKGLVTTLLITWLVQSGALDFSRLEIFYQSKKVLLATIFVWLTTMVCLSTARWIALLRVVGFQIPVRRALALQVMALFFNSVVPGNVGGDILKNQAVLGNQALKLVFLTLVERIVGVISLVWVGAIGIILSAEHLISGSGLAVISLVVLGLMVGSVIGPWLFFRFLPDSAPPSETKNTTQKGIGGRLHRSLLTMVQSTTASIQLLKSSKRQVVTSFFISFFMHLGNMGYFLFLSHELGSPEASLAQISLIFPLGMLSLVLPVSISGLGVGHLIFEELFTMVGLEGGATIFNVYILAHLALCLTGSLPYIFMRAGKTKTITPPAAETIYPKPNES